MGRSRTCAALAPLAGYMHVTAVTGPKLEPTTVAFDRVTMLSSFMRDSQCGCEMTDTRGSSAIDSVASRWCEKRWEMKQAAESRSTGACAAPHTRLVSKLRDGGPADGVGNEAKT